MSLYNQDPEVDIDQGVSTLFGLRTIQSESVVPQNNDTWIYEILQYINYIQVTGLFSSLMSICISFGQVSYNTNFLFL